MLRASQLKAMPKNHVFAKGDGEFPELSKEPIRWIAVWSGMDWCLKVSPATKNFKEVATSGRIVDIPKIIMQIMPCSLDAFKLYRK